MKMPLNNPELSDAYCAECGSIEWDDDWEYIETDYGVYWLCGECLRE